ncbi:MAG: hypothetical protein U9R32_05870 [Bacteroidota bacterium]|nr:hypothetical protein [Bacteroidota bacterium]
MLLILIGWIVSKIVSKIVVKLLKIVKLDNAVQKFSEIKWLKNVEWTNKPSKIVGKFVYWILILIFFMAATDTLGWSVVSNTINELILYIPNLFGAIVIFVIGLYIADLVRKFVKTALSSLEVASANILSDISFYFILIIVGITALDQAGVDTTIITSNITVIIAAIVFAFTISFAISSKDVFKNILSAMYSRNNYHVGQDIIYKDKRWAIEKIDRMHITLKGEKSKWIIPVSNLVSNEFEIIEK